MNGSQTGRVVVGVHRSLGAYQALRHATAEARRRRNELVVVHSLSRPVGRSAPPSGLRLSSALDIVMPVFDEALGGLPSDLDVEIVAREGDPGPALVATADRETDLLVIGGSARGWLPRLRRPPVSAHCARHAVCPVLIVPPPALARVSGIRRGGHSRRVARAAERYLSQAAAEAPSPH